MVSLASCWAFSVVVSAPAVEGSRAASGVTDVGDPGEGEGARASASADDPRPGDAADERRTIVVTAARTEQAVGDVAVSTRVIDRAAIEASGAEHLGAILEEQPGLQVLRAFGGAGGVGVQMQGLDSKYVLILVDGQRATGRVGGVLDLSRFPAEDIAQVEIVKGPGSALYGADAIAGVINIITRKASRPLEIDGRVRFGSFATADVAATVGGRRRRFTTRWSGGWSHFGGFDRDPSDPSTTGNAGHTAHAAQRSEIRLGQGVTLGIHADAQRRELGGVDSNAAGAVFDRRNLTRTASLTLTPEIVWSDPSRLRLTAHVAHFDDLYTLDQRGSDALDQEQRTLDTLGQFGAHYDALLAERHLVSAGLEGQLEFLATPRLDGGAGTRQRFALYAQDEWKIAARPRVVVVPGIRVDVDSQFGAYPSPRLAARVDPIEALTLRASAGLGFRAPSFRELYLSFANPAVGYRVTGNPDLRAETARSATAGVAWTIARRHLLAVDYFHHHLRDLITLDGASLSLGTESVFRYVNVGAARSQGIEAVLSTRIREAVDAELSYTFTRAIDLEARRRLPGRPAHQGHARVRWRSRAGTSIQARGALQGAQYYYGEGEVGGGAASPVRVAPYASVDLRVAQEALGGRINFFVGVDNLLDAGNATTLPLVPRLFYGGVTSRLRPERPLRERRRERR
ncbi:MAG: TonB-dependent receptor [Nannocystaceae bacterium]